MLFSSCLGSRIGKIAELLGIPTNNWEYKTIQMLQHIQNKVEKTLEACWP